MSDTPDRLTYTHAGFVNCEEALEHVLNRAEVIAFRQLVRNRVVIFYGEQGSGKTWLLHELEYRVQNVGLEVRFVDLKALWQEAREHASSAVAAFQAVLDGVARPLTLLIDDIHEASDEALEQLEAQVLAPLAQEKDVLIVLAERGPPHYWETPEFREKSDTFDLEPFEEHHIEEQIEKQVPETEASIDEIERLGGGYPWATWLLAKRLPAPTAPGECVSLFLAKVDKDLRPHLEALSGLRAFDETRMEPLLQTYWHNPGDQTWDYTSCRRLRQRLEATNLVQWDDKKRGYLIHEPLRRVLEESLLARDLHMWTLLHCTSYQLYADWATKYRQSRTWWLQEAQYHSIRLQDADYAPGDCPGSEEIGLEFLRLLSREEEEPEPAELAGHPEPPADAVPQVFLSYASQDRPEVEKLYQNLVDAGFKPWMDYRDILPGEKWEPCIRQAIRDSDLFLFCLTSNSAFKRGFIQKEVRVALDVLQGMLSTDIYLIPARLEDCDVPEELRELQWVNLFDDNGWPRLVAAIHEGMKRRSAGQKEEGGNGD